MNGYSHIAQMYHVGYVFHHINFDPGNIHRKTLKSVIPDGDLLYKKTLQSSNSKKVQQH